MLVEGNPGEVKARIVERDGKVLMEKDCPKHGHYEDVIAMDPEFLKRIERLYPGRDFKMAPDAWHEHGTSTVKYGRGAVLTIDLTNRCNMMCEPCFMDANQVGYVHELTREDIKQPSTPRPRSSRAGRCPSSLRRRADSFPLLPRCHRVREEDRIRIGPVRLERHPLRPGAGVLPRREKGGPALRLPPVRRDDERGE